MLIVIMLNVALLIFTNRPFMLSEIMLNVIMLSVKITNSRGAKYIQSEFHPSNRYNRWQRFCFLCHIVKRSTVELVNYQQRQRIKKFLTKNAKK
jgi:hypothetical protein